MRVESVAIKNLRCIQDAIVHLDPYTCLVGPNGAGKSTLLFALNVFFREIENAPTDVTSLAAKDFYREKSEAPVEITVTFGDLSDEAKQDFAGYVRQDRLVVTALAVFDPKSGRADVKQFGERLGMPGLKPFFKAHGDGALVADLRKIFEELESAIPDLAAKKSKKTKDAMYETLRGYELDKADKCELIRSEDQFYGVTKGANRLEKYIQWIFIPAVKDATEEQSETKSSALGKLLARTVRAKVNFSEPVDTLLHKAREQYEKMLKENEPALTDISEALSKRLTQWAHPDASLRVVWQQDSSKAVRVDPPAAGVVAGESGFEGDLARFGHGFQRSYLLALLQELASVGANQGAPTLLLACEEPELYQHPPQARHLASVFEKLTQDSAQIIVSTHSPYFVTGKRFESVRLVRRDGPEKCATIRQYTYAEMAKRFGQVVGEPPKAESAALSKVHQALQPMLNEMFFTQRLVLVEGLEDLAYIHSWLVLTDRWEKYRRSGCHIVPVNGKSEMIRPAIIAQGLRIPVFAVIDADGDKIAKPDVRTRHHRDNVALLRLLGGKEGDAFPPATNWSASFVMWPSNLGDVVREEFVASMGLRGEDRFADLENRARTECGNAGDLGKNAAYIGSLLTMAHEANLTSRSLDELCDRILAFSGA